MVASLLCLAAIGLSSCTLSREAHYQVNDAPPNGIYVNIYTLPTSQLHTALSAICKGDVHCLMNLMKEYKLRDDWLGFAAGLLWREALGGEEYDDFAEAIIRSMGTDDGQPRCLNLTIRAEVPYWYYEGYDYNWSYRPLRDANCQVGQSL